MRRFPCPYLNADVELTPERERHISERHPELSDKINECLAKTLADPNQVRRSSRFANTRLFSRNFEDLWDQKQLVVGGRFPTWPASSLDHYLLFNPQVLIGRIGMDSKLTFKYDRESDILYIDKCSPYQEQDSEELGDDVIARLNPLTHEVENLEVLFFSTRLLRTDLIELPITATLRLMA